MQNMFLQRVWKLLSSTATSAQKWLEHEQRNNKSHQSQVIIFWPLWCILQRRVRQPCVPSRERGMISSWRERAGRNRQPAATAGPLESGKGNYSGVPSSPSDVLFTTLIYGVAFRKWEVYVFHRIKVPGKLPYHSSFLSFISPSGCRWSSRAR